MFRLFIVCFIFLFSEAFSEELPRDLYDKLRETKNSLTSHVVWVKISQQKLLLFVNGSLRSQSTISTAKNGVGQQTGSQQTPLGLHRVFQKFGQGALHNTIFVARRNTGKVWKPGMEASKDFVLTRIFWLEGLERGFNQGWDAQGIQVDSRQRMIYIHGTNQEAFLGTPASQGCIRMEKTDLLSLFDEIPEGSLVWISL